MFVCGVGVGRITPFALDHDLPSPLHCPPNPPRRAARYTHTLPDVRVEVAGKEHQGLTGRTVQTCQSVHG